MFKLKLALQLLPFPLVLINESILMKEVGNRWAHCQSVKLNDFGDNTHTLTILLTSNTLTTFISIVIPMFSLPQTKKKLETHWRKKCHVLVV